MAVLPKDAATVMLLRDSPGGGGVQVLMVRRHADSNFAGGSYVFPGGKLDPEDCGEKTRALCRGISPEKAAVLMPDVGSPDKSLGFWIAGLREVFEESGLLLAYGPDGGIISLSGEIQERFRIYRQQLQKSDLLFSEMIRRENLYLAVDRLFYFSHWITPETSPVRFDTRFFVAESPPGQEPLHDERETTENVWISPRSVAKSDPNDFPMVFPTLKSLEVLTAFGSVAEVLKATEGKLIPAIIPRIILKDGKKRLVIPGDREYSDSRYIVKVGGKPIEAES